MNVGETLFAQVMDFVPWTSFARIVQRHSGDLGVRTLTCAEQWRARKLYASEPLGVELGNTVYALDSSTIDLCLSLFA